MTYEFIRSPEAAEENAAKHLRRLGYLDARVTGRGADGGIDVTSSQAIAQVKWKGAQVPSHDIQKLFGARGLNDHLTMFFFAASGYSKKAVQYADDVDIRLFVFDPDGSIHPANGVAERAVQRSQATSGQESQERAVQRSHATYSQESQARALESERKWQARLEPSRPNVEQTPIVDVAKTKSSGTKSAPSAPVLLNGGAPQPERDAPDLLNRGAPQPERHAPDLKLPPAGRPEYMAAPTQPNPLWELIIEQKNRKSQMITPLQSNEADQPSTANQANDPPPSVEQRRPNGLVRLLRRMRPTSPFARGWLFTPYVPPTPTPTRAGKLADRRNPSTGDTI